jgi:hypothetical protein
VLTPTFPPPPLFCPAAADDCCRIVCAGDLGFAAALRPLDRHCVVDRNISAVLDEVLGVERLGPEFRVQSGGRHLRDDESDHAIRTTRDETTKMLIGKTQITNKKVNGNNYRQIIRAMHCRQSSNTLIDTLLNATYCDKLYHIIPLSFNLLYLNGLYALISTTFCTTHPFCLHLAAFDETAIENKSVKIENRTEKI